MSVGNSRTWRGLAIGTALGTLAWLLPWVILKATKPETFYVLAYSRNTGPVGWAEKDVKDPAPMLANVTDYPVQIAMGCGIPHWIINSNQGTTDVDRTAWLRIRASLVDDNAFNCLSRYVRPPYVRLKRGSERALRDQNAFGE